MPKNITDKIYTIRGQKIMLDYDLAEIYGYTTSAFNQQVMRNINRFEGEDFMFRLNSDELPIILLSQNVIAKADGRGGDRRMPYAFTEQGIYMLMTVLKGELAIKQSRILIRLFKKMKDYIIGNQSTIECNEIFKITTKTTENTTDIAEIKTKVNKMNTEVEDIKHEIDGMIKKSELSPILIDFSKQANLGEYLFINGEIIKAKNAIIGIYRKAKNKIIIIDNYVSYNTLRLLLETKPNIEILVYTHNTNNYLKDTDIKEFKKERPDIEIKLIKTNNFIHDRFIILDDCRIYNLGTSSKDIGTKLTMMHEIKDIEIKKTIMGLISQN